MTEQDTKAVSTKGAPKAIRVAGIIDEYRVVLNVGRKDGVRTDDTFLIYGVGGDIEDPETGENLGVLELIRGRGRIEHLQDAICTIKSTMKRQVPGHKKLYRRERSGGMGALSILGYPNVEEVEEGARSVDEPFDGAQLGDYARKI